MILSVWKSRCIVLWREMCGVEEFFTQRHTLYKYRPTLPHYPLKHSLDVLRLMSNRPKRLSCITAALFCAKSVVLRWHRSPVGIALLAETPVVLICASGFLNPTAHGIAHSTIKFDINGTMIYWSFLSPAERRGCYQVWRWRRFAYDSSLTEKKRKKKKRKERVWR